MAHYIALFSPETYEAFSKSSWTIAGFPPTQKTLAEKVRPGDKFICYLTKLSRWVGVLEATGECFEDDTPRFLEMSDPFTVRFQVRPLVWLPKEKAVPIHESSVWNTLSFTKDQNPKTALWTIKVRYSLSQLDAADGVFIESILEKQARGGKIYEVDEKEYQKLIGHQIRRLDKLVTVSVPEEPETLVDKKNEAESRESIRIQALIANIGAQMGMKIWIPQTDQNRVLREWQAPVDVLLKHLPLNYDETTIKTIEQIDVLWLKGRSIIRAFEVEHTTSIYSGILRMADLLALQPNMNIKLHIVAPYVRRDKVFNELKRPVFSLLDRGPLAESCTYISYDSLRELAELKHLSHLSDTVLDEYAEEAE